MDAASSFSDYSGLVDPEDSTLDQMKSAKRWLLSRDKRPFYIDGSPRGATDTDEDRVWLATYDEAMVALSARGAGWLLGFALGPDGSGGHWQGIDFDDIEKHKHGIASRDWALRDASLPGYVELSPSKKGIHVIGYGRAFTNLGSNGTGIEAYANGRFFTFTGDSIRDGVLTDLADYIVQTLAPLHGAARALSASKGVHEVTIDPQTVTELRSALFHLRADEYDLWIRMGIALRELGEVGRGIWIEWSRTSEKWEPGHARKWDTFGPTDTSYQAVFAEAQRRGWVNPKSKAAQGSGGSTDDGSSDDICIKLKTAMGDELETTRLEYLADPFLPSRHVVGFYGKGECGKSSILATLSALVSHFYPHNKASTLWISTEEREDFIRIRHTETGVGFTAEETEHMESVRGVKGTLHVLEKPPTKRDKEGRAKASSFNVYEHLYRAIAEGQTLSQELGSPPVRLVVLDTIVALTKWERGESPNDDAAVKKLISFLEGAAQEHNLTIAIVGHSNKGKHDDFSDAVMGARAWVDGPRLSFIHTKDRREDYSFVIRAAKNNLGPKFAMAFKTFPVHMLHERAWAPGGNSVLCKTTFTPLVWGEGACAHLWDEATAKPRDDEAGGPRRAGGGRAEKVLECLLKVVAEANGPVGREQVAFQIALRHGDMKIHRSDWAKVDQLLAERDYLMVKAHKRPDAKNATFYSRIAP